MPQTDEINALRAQLAAERTASARLAASAEALARAYAGDSTMHSPDCGCHRFDPSPCGGCALAGLRAAIQNWRAA